jgi:hypothetical protein
MIQSKDMSSAKPKASTGIAGLDQILLGGFPLHRLYLVCTPLPSWFSTPSSTARFHRDLRPDSSQRARSFASSKPGWVLADLFISKLFSFKHDCVTITCVVLNLSAQWTGATNFVFLSGPVRGGNTKARLRNRVSREWVHCDWSPRTR